MEFDLMKEWFLGLGAQYGVNPVIFGLIYVGAIPFFTLSMARAVRNLRRGKPIITPVLFAGFFFISAYLYLIIAGHNIPLWVYLFIAVMVGYGVFATFKKIRRARMEVSTDGV